MANEIGEKDGIIDEENHVSYKDALLDGEPQQPEFHPDPSIIETIHHHHNKKKERQAGGKNGNNKNDGLQNLKTSLLISGAVIGVIGVICVVAKKIKEKT